MEAVTMKKSVALVLVLALVFTFGVQSVAFAEEPAEDIEIIMEPESVEVEVEEVSAQPDAEEPIEAEPDMCTQSPDAAGETTVKYDFYSVTYSFKYSNNADGSVTITGMNVTSSGSSSNYQYR